MYNLWKKRIAVSHLVVSGRRASLPRGVSRGPAAAVACSALVTVHHVRHRGRDGCYRGRDLVLEGAPLVPVLRACVGLRCVSSTLSLGGWDGWRMEGPGGMDGVVPAGWIAWAG